jgi:phosphatidate cytidylyltransferase
VLLKRALTVSVFLAACTAVLLLSHYRIGALVSLTAANLLVAVGLREFYLLARTKGSVSLAYGIFCGLVYCTLTFLTLRNPLLVLPLPPTILPLSCFMLLFLFFLWRSLAGDYESALFDFAALAAGLVFVAWLFSFIVRINYLSPIGPWWVLSLILIAGGTDTFAYLLGKAFGKRKFFPRISPNKTVEGFVGGTLSGIVLGVLCTLLFPLKITFGQGLLLATIISLTSHLGDLAESVLKRDAGVKDSGWLPGVGGVLDMLDSILFTAPIAYFFMRFWLFPCRP